MRLHTTEETTGEAAITNALPTPTTHAVTTPRAATRPISQGPSNTALELGAPGARRRTTVSSSCRAALVSQQLLLRKELTHAHAPQIRHERCTDRNADRRAWLYTRQRADRVAEHIHDEHSCREPGAPRRTTPKARRRKGTGDAHAEHQDDAPRPPPGELST